MAVSWPCDTCGITPRRFLSCPGSLLPGLRWLTGLRLEDLLNPSRPGLIHHETRVHAEWIISRHEMP